MRLVEPPGLSILLEDPEAEASRAEFARLREQRRANAVAVLLRVDVEVREHVVLHRNESGRTSTQHRDPHLMLCEHDVAHPHAILGRRVKFRQVRHAHLARVREQRGDGERVGRRRAAQRDVGNGHVTDDTGELESRRCPIIRRVNDPRRIQQLSPSLEFRNLNDA